MTSKRDFIRLGATFLPAAAAGAMLSTTASAASREESIIAIAMNALTKLGETIEATYSNVSIGPNVHTTCATIVVPKGRWRLSACAQQWSGSNEYLRAAISKQAGSFEGARVGIEQVYVASSPQAGVATAVISDVTVELDKDTPFHIVVTAPNQAIAAHGYIKATRIGLKSIVG